MTHYLAVGIGVYLSAAIIRRKLFKKANGISILKGLVLAILLWPVGLFVMLYLEDE